VVTVEAHKEGRSGKETGWRCRGRGLKRVEEEMRRWREKGVVEESKGDREKGGRDKRMRKEEEAAGRGRTRRKVRVSR